MEVIKYRNSFAPSTAEELSIAEEIKAAIVESAGEFTESS